MKIVAMNKNSVERRLKVLVRGQQPGRKGMIK